MSFVQTSDLQFESVEIGLLKFPGYEHSL